jgi:hypothetical protein
MSELLMQQSDRTDKNRRVGVFLALLILFYIAAVIAFIIVY